ncbi:MAG: methyltransferase [Pseudomonadota bacterium]
MRDAVIGAPAFHRVVEATPFTRPIASRYTRATFDLVAGFVYSQTLAVLIELKILTRLRAGPQTTEHLAAATGVAADRLDKVLVAAAAIGLVDRRRKGWGLALRGAAISAQDGITHMVRHHHHLYADLTAPVELAKGPRATALADYWTYTAHSAGSDVTPYSALMAASQPFVSTAILHNRVFREARTLVDLGGGAGAFAIAALKRQPKLTVTVADRAEVVPLAADALAAAGLAERAHVHALDFFTDSLAFEADAISLVRVLHDHDDGSAAALLSRLAKESPGAALLLIEPMAHRSRPSGLDAYFPWYFLAMGQGRLRTPAEIRVMLEAAGYGSIKALHSRNPTLAQGLIARV